MISSPLLRLARLAPVAIVLLGLLGTSAAVAQPVVTALVDRNQVTLEDQIRLEVTVRGTPDGAPVLPELPDFRVVSAGNAPFFVASLNTAKSYVPGANPYADPITQTADLNVVKTT